MWVGWRDRHRTICVKLPRSFTDDFGFESLSKLEIEILLEDAGIGVKS